MGVEVWQVEFVMIVLAFLEVQSEFKSSPFSHFLALEGMFKKS
jgi:hypothetical protein